MVVNLTLQVCALMIPPNQLHGQDFTPPIKISQSGHDRTAKEETETSNNRGITACEDASYDNTDHVETKTEEECPRR